MFGANERVGQKFFAEAPNGSLLVVSVFMTLQGEGPYRGKRCVFIRLAKCQLACHFCDTYFDNGTWVEYADLMQRVIDQFAAEVDIGDSLILKRLDDENIVVYDCGLVITGGEPSLQDNLSPFLEVALQNFKWVQIESNGILLNKNLPDNVTLVISPKCAEKVAGKPSNYLKPSAKVLERANALKFVMCSDEDSPYSTVPQWAHQWLWDNPHKEVFVSPMNIYNENPTRTADMSIEERSKVDEVVDFWNPGLLNQKANEANHKYAARYAMKHGFTFQIQEHLLAGLA